MESHLRYANVIWGSLSNTKLEGLQRLQHRAQSIIERANIRDQWSRDWLTVEQPINFDRSVMTYKMTNKVCPESLWDRYKTRNIYSRYRTRNCTDIQIPRYNPEYVKKASTIQLLLRGTASLSQSGNCQPSRSSKER